ncbi:MAG: T9SS type A sorting domain-containing protein [Bacteroidota bacterium]
MKKTLHLFIAVTLFFGLATTSFGQIFMDGDSTDWEGYPLLVEAPDNVDGMFPPEVGAVVTDVVDIKNIKATVIGNVLFGYLEFWGGPAWPNNAYENDHEGTIYYESRGYYHLLLDIDNDATTGWSTDWYEAHYTPVGYLISQGVALEPIGAEVMTECFYRTNDDWKVANEGADPIRGYGQWAADYEEYDGQTDNGSDYEVFDMNVPNADSARVMAWQGSLNIDSSDDQALLDDTLRSYWVGQAWGHSFLEFGVELTPFQVYYANKDGRSVLQPGDVIGLCGMTETPIDDWGVDMTTRGEVTVAADAIARSQTITFDGDESDWADLPLLIEAPDNVDGMFPPEVGAVVTDVVDIKEIKAFIEGDNLFFNMKFWGGPAWPNNAYENDHEGTIYYESRGYYHVLMDIDNDPATGWSTDWYEAHYTPVGYLISQGVALEPIGAEVMQENFFRTNDDWKVANEGKNPIRGAGQWGADYEEYDGQTDNGSDYEIYNYDIIEADSVSIMRFDGMQLNNSSDRDIIDGNPDWIGHAWGNDFIETGVSLRTIKKYYKDKDGRDVLQTGDVIGICGMTETPIDDWGVDMTTRGEISVVAVGVAKENPVMVEKFNLANNYPNPFNPSTKIQYSLPTNEFVSLKVYDIIGREVATLVNQQQSSGVYDVEFNASHLTSGVYFYKIEAGSFAQVKKMMLIK